MGQNNTSYSKDGSFFIKLALLILGGGSMWCPNVGAEFKSQYLSHLMPNLGGGFPFKQGDDCAQLDGVDQEEEKNECTCCLIHEKGNLPK